MQDIEENVDRYNARLGAAARKAGEVEERQKAENNLLKQDIMHLKCEMLGD